MVEGRVVDKALIDYLLPRRMFLRLLDVKVWRREGGECLCRECGEGVGKVQRYGNGVYQ